MEVDWDGYRVLLAVSEHGSFSAAARVLGISQPTAGRKIAALEEQLGAKLLVRRSRGVVLTPAGEEVEVQARRMADGAHAAARRAVGQSVDARTPVRVTVTEGLGVLWLPHRLLPLTRALPSLRLEVGVDNAAVDLAARKADIAVRLFRPREPDLIARKVATLGFAFFASPAYLKERGAPRRLTDLARHDVIGFASSRVVPSYLPWLQKVVPPERFVYCTSNLVAQHEAARAGFGIVIATRALLQGDPRVRRVLPRVRVPSMDVWLAVHADVRKNPGIAQVYEHLVEVFAREAPSLA